MKAKAFDKLLEIAMRSPRVIDSYKIEFEYVFVDTPISVQCNEDCLSYRFYWNNKRLHLYDVQIEDLTDILNIKLGEKNSLVEYQEKLEEDILKF
jgi:hypothetical protein